jgi:hypothetical protein
MAMGKLLIAGGRWLGSMGLLLCLVAVIWRLLGNFHLGGFEVATLFEGGTAAVLIGCFLLLLGLLDRRE